MVSSYEPRPQGRWIFDERKDRETFITLLKETANLWNVHTSAFCLMDNHYYILAQTPLGNLARFMRHLNGVYTRAIIVSINMMDSFFAVDISLYWLRKTVPFGTGQIYSQESRPGWNS